MSCGVGRRRDLDPALPRLYRRPAAVAPIGRLAWELPYASGGALKRQNKQTNKQTNKKNHQLNKKTRKTTKKQNKIKCVSLENYEIVK